MAKRRLSLVPRGALRRLVRTAVVRSLAHRDDGNLADLLVEELAREIKSVGRPIAGMTRSDVIDELERSHDALHRARDRAHAELEQLQAGGGLQLLAAMHDSPYDAVGRGDDPGALSREKQALTDVDEAFARTRREGLSSEALRDRIVALTLEAARRERRELIAEMRAEHERRVELLERRVAKLNRSLELSEAALQELASRKGLDGGLASIYRAVQGLAADAPYADKKRALLEQIFLANAELRGLRAERLGSAELADYELPRAAAARPATNQPSR